MNQNLSPLEMALSTYEAAFGKPYMLYISDSKTDEEILQEISDCLSSGKQQQPPKYIPGIVY